MICGMERPSLRGESPHFLWLWVAPFDCAQGRLLKPCPDTNHLKPALEAPTCPRSVSGQLLDSAETVTLHSLRILASVTSNTGGRRDRTERAMAPYSAFVGIRLCREFHHPHGVALAQE